MLHLYKSPGDYFYTSGRGEPVASIPHEHVYDLDANPDKHETLEAIQKAGHKAVKFAGGKVVKMLHPVSLARGAAVVNNQYYAPGKFIARALESIETAVARRRARKVSLAAGYSSGTNETPVSLARKTLTTPFGTYEMWTSPPKTVDDKYHVINFSKMHTEYPGSHLQELTNESGPAGAYLFHHVGKFVDDFITNEKPEHFKFSSDLHEEKRRKAYDAVAPLLAAKHGYDLTHKDEFGARHYRFTRKPPVSLARKSTMTPPHEVFMPFARKHMETGDHTPLLVGADALEEAGHTGMAALVRRAVEFDGRDPRNIKPFSALRPVRHEDYTIDPNNPSPMDTVDDIAFDKILKSKVRVESMWHNRTPINVHEWVVHTGGRKLLHLKAPLSREEVISIAKGDTSHSKDLKTSAKWAHEVARGLPDNRVAQAYGPEHISTSGIPKHDPVLPLARFTTVPKSRLTPEDVRSIEDAHGKNPPRLPYTVRPDGTIKTNVHELHDWFDKISKRQGKMPKGDKAQTAFLVSHFGQAAQTMPEEGWYGDKITEMEEGFKKAFPHVHPKAIKALVAVTSPGQKPHHNIDSVFRILKAGLKRNVLSPVDAMPTHDLDSFQEWKDRENPDETALKPGFDQQNLAWSAVYRGKNPGYSEALWLLNKATGKVERKMNKNEDTKVPSGYKVVRFPSPDAEGNLRPKGWGARPSIAKHLETIRGKHQELGPEGFGKWMDENAEQFGPKVGAFYRNLIGQNEHVTKDVWMTRTFRRLLGKIATSTDAPTAKEGKLIDKAMVATAKHMSISPSELQARLWYYEQNLHRIFGTEAPSQDFASGVREAINKHGLPGRSE